MNDTQAKALAKKIFDEFDKQIVEATNGTSIPPSFIAGLIANEAGKDRQGNIKRSATRFEKHVYAKLVNVSKNPRAKYGSITHNDLKDATDAALRALATSHEATQMMGYHVITLHCTLADLKNPDKHFFYTVKLLQLNGFPTRPTSSRMDDEMRQWNTGREKGKTYHANYVPNAQKIRAAYAELEKGRVSRSVLERTVPASEPEYNPEENYMNPANDPHADEPGTVVNEGTENPPSQTAENIINMGEQAPPPSNKPVDEQAPAATNITADSSKMTILGFAVPTVFVTAIASLKSAIAEGYVDAKEVGSAVLSFVMENQKYVFGLIGLIIVGKLLTKAYKQITFLVTLIINANPAWNNVNVKPGDTAPAKPWWRIW